MNLHALRRYHLKVVRLPISPRSHDIIFVTKMKKKEEEVRENRSGLPALRFPKFYKLREKLLISLEINNGDRRNRHGHRGLHHDLRRVHRDLRRVHRDLRRRYAQSAHELQKP